MSSSEFQLINRYFRNALADSTDVIQGIGDDAAIVTLPPGMELALSMDTLVAGVHFPEQCSAEDIGYKSLAVNLSDMAAMGAKPCWITLSMTLPEKDESWMQQFMGGFTGLARQFDLSLIGGDLTHGPMSVTVQLHGMVPAGGALYRKGAKPGDQIYVSGTLGDAGLALALMQEGYEGQVEGMDIMQRLHRPAPRVEPGIMLRNIASSAIDISDGLLSDLNHILVASGVGARIDMDRIPLSPAVKNHPHALQLAIAAGDDYELCFTVPAEKIRELEALARDCPLTRIGEITAEQGIQWRQPDGTEFVPQRSAYSHF